MERSTLCYLCLENRLYREVCVELFPAPVGFVSMVLIGRLFAKMLMLCIPTWHVSTFVHEKMQWMQCKISTAESIPHVFDNSGSFLPLIGTYSSELTKSVYPIFSIVLCFSRINMNAELEILLP